MAFDNEPRMLTAAELWAIDDTPERTIDIPEWNNRQVRIRGLTLEQISSVASRATHRDPRTNLEVQDRALLTAFTIIEGMVEPKLTAADVGRLRTRSAVAVTRIVQAITNLGASEDAIADADKSAGDGLDAALSVFPGVAIRQDAGRTETDYVGA